MTLEDRLAKHLRMTGDAVNPPLATLAALRSRLRGRRLRLIAATAIAALGAASAVAVTVMAAVALADWLGLGL
jgi:hypothetical protein